MHQTDACGAQLLQEHDGTEFPTNYSFTYLHGHTKANGAPQNKKLMVCIMQSQNGIIMYKRAEVIVCIMTTNHLARFLNGKNASNN